MLEKASIAFERGEPGEALLYCEKAKALHTAEINAFISNLNQSLAPSEVKKAGDDIMNIRSVLEKRNDSAAIAILDAVLLNHKVEYFGKSMQSLLSWLEKRLVYPEADFLTGKIYETEGESLLALTYYEKAWLNRDFLDIPDEKYTLAYRMADLSFEMGNSGAQEKYLILVLLDDIVYGKPGETSPTLQAMMKTLQDDKTAEKFFLLYRHSNYTALKAYQDLAALYYKSRNYGRALPAAVLASCVSVTRLSEALRQADFEYEYATFSDLLIRSGKKPAVVLWAGEIKLWESFLILASILHDTGEKNQAVSVLTALGAYCPDRTVSRQALKSLAVMNP